MPEGSADWPPSAKDVLCQAFMPDGSGSATVRRGVCRRPTLLYVHNTHSKIFRHFEMPKGRAGH
eukprot:scaffold4241_cov145-Isochrysis_galbana.AAC.1